MNVREVCGLLKKAKVIMLAYGDNVIQFKTDDLLMMDAYGRYAVDEVRSPGEDEYEISLALRPIREGA
jgi:hypothetical protein